MASFEAIAPSAADVKVYFGDVPSTLESCGSRGLAFQASEGNVLFELPDVARFWIRSGSEVIIKKAQGMGVKTSAVSFFLQGPVLGALLQQRELFVFRGGAMEVKGEAVAFIGLPGAGKSTLLMRFNQKGYRLVSDEYCVARPDYKGRWELVAGGTRLTIWNDALHNLDLSNQGLKPVRKGIKKYSVPCLGHVGEGVKPLAKIFIVKSLVSERVAVADIDSFGLFSALQSFPHFTSVLTGLGLAHEYKQRAMTLAAHVPAASIERPRRGCAVNDLVESIEQHFPK